MSSCHITYMQHYYEYLLPFYIKSVQLILYTLLLALQSITCYYRTPLHCAASCNNLPMVKLLVENGACIFAATISDQETAAEKCEEDEDGFDGCSEYLYSM